MKLGEKKFADDYRMHDQGYNFSHNAPRIKRNIKRLLGKARRAEAKKIIRVETAKNIQ